MTVPFSVKATYITVSLCADWEGEVGEWRSPTMKNRKTGEMMSEKDRKRELCSQSLALNTDVCDPQQHPGTRIKPSLYETSTKNRDPGLF